MKHLERDEIRYRSRGRLIIHIKVSKKRVKNDMKKMGVLLLLTLFSTQGFSKELTLDEIIKEYMSYSPALKAAKAQSLSAHHEFKEAVTKFLPRLSLNGSYQTLQHPAGSIEGSSNMYQASLDVKQNLFKEELFGEAIVLKNSTKNLKN